MKLLQFYVQITVYISYRDEIDTFKQFQSDIFPNAAKKKETGRGGREREKWLNIYFKKMCQKVERIIFKL